MVRTFEVNIMLLALCVGSALAGEVAVDPGGNGADVIEDTTEDIDSHSSEVAAAVANHRQSFEYHRQRTIEYDDCQRERCRTSRVAFALAAVDHPQLDWQAR